PGRRAGGHPHPADAGQADDGRGGGRGAGCLQGRVSGIHQRLQPDPRGPLSTEGRALRPDPARRALRYMKITDTLEREGGLDEVVGTTKDDVIVELAGVVAARHPEINHGRLVGALEERERLNSTALGEGVAIPHGKLSGLTRVVAAFGRSRRGVDFSSLD